MTLRVNTFLAGAPKCGTSSLAAWLDTHPAVCVSRPKEPHFFGTRGQPASVASWTLDQYHDQCFAHFRTHEHRVILDATPQVLADPEALLNILEYQPTARFIVLLRNPVDLYFSWHREMLKGLVEDNPDPREAWNLQDARAAGTQPLPPGCEHPEHLLYRDLCLLGKQVETLFRYVDLERIKIHLLEDLITDPAKVYRETCEFLDVDIDSRKEFPRVNPGVEWRSDVLRKTYRYAYLIKRFVLGSRPLPFSLDQRIKHHLGMKNVEREQDRELVWELQTEFEPDVRLLESLIQKNLSSWLP